MESFELKPSPIERPEREMGIEELREEIEYLREQIGIDPLTGAKNRGFFDQELERLLKMIGREAEEHRTSAKPLTEISLIMLDLDHFKQVNDTFGHQAGDTVLRKVSALLMDSVRETDIVARYGGEELMVLLREADQSFAAQKAEELRAGIEQIKFDAHPDLKISASIGVISSRASTDARTLCDLVDKDLYAAKNAGRNQVVIHNKNEPLPTTSE